MKIWLGSSLLFSTLLFSTIGLALAQKQPAANESSTVVWRAPAGDPAQFAGSEECGNCHIVEMEQHAKTAHASSPAGATGTGCESCHGPGKAHADAVNASQGDAARIEAARLLIFAFNSSPKENSARCLNCHQTSQDQQHFDRSEHHFGGVACHTCHAAHLLEPAEMPMAARTLEPLSHFFVSPSRTEEQRWLSSSLLRKSQPDLCYGCHGVVQGQFSLPSHHRVNEGLMKCSDCHSPHGTRNQPMLKKTNWEGCINCHIEKRGPFLFEHAAAKVEGCTACHSPHGSVSRHLLLRREGRFLCLQCHVDPHAPNVPHGRLTFTTRGECVRCHVTVHGSNHSEFLLD
jgi:predicted CXXCH cytochrome family protein